MEENKTLDYSSQINNKLTNKLDTIDPSGVIKRYNEKLITKLFDYAKVKEQRDE